MPENSSATPEGTSTTPTVSERAASAEHLGLSQHELDELLQDNDSYVSFAAHAHC